MTRALGFSLPLKRSSSAGSTVLQFFLSLFFCSLGHKSVFVTNGSQSHCYVICLSAYVCTGKIILSPFGRPGVSRSVVLSL